MSKARELSQLGDKIDIDDTTGDFAVDTDTLYVDVSDSRVGIGLNTNISSALHVDSETSLGPDNNNRMILGSTSGGVGSIGTIEGGTASFNTMTFKGGKVGIGTGSPQVTFDCQDDSALAASISGYSVASSASRPASGALRIGSGAGSTGLLLDYHDGGQTKATIRNQYVASNDSELSIESPHITFNTGTSYAESMRIDSSGRLGVGSSSPSTYTGRLVSQISGGSSAPTIACVNSTVGGTLRMIDFFQGTSTTRVGSIQSNASSTAYNTSSDYRLKENVTDVTDGITRVKQLAPKRFNFIADADTTVDGFLAHEAATVVPEAVTGTKDAVQVWAEGEELPDGVSVGDNKLDDNGNTIIDPQGIDQSKLVPLLTAALQEAITKIETLETENTAIKARLDALEAE